MKLDKDESPGARKAFKDYFDRAAARRIAKQVSGPMPSFDEAAFVRLATKGLGKLEFQGRVQNFSVALRKTLPERVPKALSILTESLPAVLPNCDSVTDGWLQWPIGQFIADYGVEHFDVSMTAMTELTKRFSSEFAVRPFIEKRPKETFARLYALTEDSNPHVRRWCSEGPRPRLPWGKRLDALVKDPKPLWPIVEALRDDPEEYVRRSVANNLNDISKDHPAAVAKRCRRWMKGASADRERLVKHALRTLVKAGDPAALAVVGHGPPQKLSATLSVSPGRVQIGESVSLQATLHSRAARAQDLLVDYVVHYVRQGGKTGEKVFKWTTRSVAGGEKLVLQKQHSVRRTSIRALYPGIHKVELQVNGVRLASGKFRLQE